jgi:hypothetical protein
VWFKEHARHLWYLAVCSGWLAVIALGFGWHARRKFRALLKAPLTEEVEHMTHEWEKHVTRSTAAGFVLSGFSLLCFALWLIV